MMNTLDTSLLIIRWQKFSSKLYIWSYTALFFQRVHQKCIQDIWWRWIFLHDLSQRLVFCSIKYMNQLLLSWASWIMLRWPLQKNSTANKTSFEKLNYSQAGLNSSSWCCLNFFPLAIPYFPCVLFLPPKDMDVFLCLYKLVDFLMSLCNAQSEICCKPVSRVSFFPLLHRTLSPAVLLLCQHFPLEIF